jgi:hypothetical protein
MGFGATPNAFPTPCLPVYGGLGGGPRHTGRAPLRTEHLYVCLGGSGSSAPGATEHVMPRCRHLVPPLSPHSRCNSELCIAACQALTSIAAHPDGRIAIRTSGGLQPLVQLLAEGVDAPTAINAALALMNCSACDACKVRGWLAPLHA